MHSLNLYRYRRFGHNCRLLLIWPRSCVWLDTHNNNADEWRPLTKHFLAMASTREQDTPYNVNDRDTIKTICLIGTALCVCVCAFMCGSPFDTQHHHSDELENEISATLVCLVLVLPANASTRLLNDDICWIFHLSCFLFASLLFDLYHFVILYNFIIRCSKDWIGIGSTECSSFVLAHPRFAVAFSLWQTRNFWAVCFAPTARARHHPLVSRGISVRMRPGAKPCA